MSTPLKPAATTDWSNMAMKGQQLMDNSGNAIDVQDVIGSGGNKYIAGGSTLTLTFAAHANKTIKLDTAGGTAITLPAATGSGAIYRFVVSVLATSAAHTITCAGSDKLQGIIHTGDDTAANEQWFAAVAGTSTIITLNRSTTGSVTIGEWIEVEDFAAARWQVRGFVTNTGSAATAFS